MALITREAMEVYQKESKNNVREVNGDGKSVAYMNQSTKTDHKYRPEVKSILRKQEVED